MSLVVVCEIVGQQEKFVKVEIITYGGGRDMTSVTQWDKDNSPIKQLSQDVHLLTLLLSVSSSLSSPETAHSLLPL